MMAKTLLILREKKRAATIARNIWTTITIMIIFIISNIVLVKSEALPIATINQVVPSTGITAKYWPLLIKLLVLLDSRFSRVFNAV